MKKMILIPLVTILGPSMADPTVTLPWSEFEPLYRRQIEMQLKETLGSQQSMPVHVLERAEYHLRIDTTQAIGTVQIRGRILHGEPEPIRIFARDLAVTEIKEIVGAHLLADREGYELYAGGQGEFRATFGVTVPLHRDGPLLRLSFGLPAAVANVLSLEMSPTMSLVDSGGLRSGSGGYYFMPAQTLSLGFERTVIPAAGGETVNIDSFTALRLSGERLKASSYFVPVRAVNGRIRIRLSPSAVALSSSLPRERIEVGDAGTVDVDLPSGWRDPFVLHYEVAAVDEVELRLPEIVGNDAREGEFRIEQAAEARIEVKNTDLRSGLPAHGIDEAMRDYSGLDQPYARLTGGKRLRLAIDRLQNVAAPEVVLESLYLYASYAEDGSVLGGIRLIMPADAGSRLVLQAVPGAEIWSLRVNGQPASLYAQGAEYWIVPLAADGTTEIELAFLQRGPKLELEGRLELVFPGTGVTAREVRVAIGLSERVDLISLDSELQPATARDWPLLQGFSGRPHFFTRPYYRGEGMAAAIYYREPVVHGGGR